MAIEARTAAAASTTSVSISVNPRVLETPNDRLPNSVAVDIGWRLGAEGEHATALLRAVDIPLQSAFGRAAQLEPFATDAMGL